MNCEPNTGTHVGPVLNGRCSMCGGNVGNNWYLPTPPTEATSTLDKLIADAIEKARDKAKDEILKAFAGAGFGQDFPEVRALVAKEAERLLREDAEVKQQLRDAMIRALNAPAPKRAW